MRSQGFITMGLGIMLLGIGLLALTARWWALVDLDDLRRYLDEHGPPGVAISVYTAAGFDGIFCLLSFTGLAGLLRGSRNGFRLAFVTQVLSFLMSVLWIVKIMHDSLEFQKVLPERFPEPTALLPFLFFNFDWRVPLYLLASILCGLSLWKCNPPRK